MTAQKQTPEVPEVEAKESPEPGLTSGNGAGDSLPRNEATLSRNPLRRGLGWLVGLLLLALYVVSLARYSIDAAMGSGSLPRLPGGWKPIGALLVLLLVAVAA